MELHQSKEIKENDLPKKNTNNLKLFEFFFHKINTIASVNKQDDLVFMNEKAVFKEKNFYIKSIVIKKLLNKIKNFKSIDSDSNSQKSFLSEANLRKPLAFHSKASKDNLSKELKQQHKKGLGPETQFLECNSLMHKKDLKIFTLFFSLDQFFFEITKKQAQFQKFSKYKLQLKERKKLSILYGNLSKKQLEKIIKQAQYLQGNIAENILNILETKLDIALVRFNFFKTLPLARQWISHQKVFVNKHIVTLPGYLLKPGDVISIMPKHFSKFEKSLILSLNQSIKKRSSRLLISEVFFQKLINKKKLQFNRKEKYKNSIRLLIKVLINYPLITLKKQQNQLLNYSNDTHLKKNKILNQSNKIKFSKNILFKSFLQLQKHKIFYKNSFFHLQLKKYINKHHTQKQKLLLMRLNPMKALHFEVSYRIFTAIYLYFPQKILSTAPIDFDLILRS